MWCFRSIFVLFLPIGMVAADTGPGGLQFAALHQKVTGAFGQRFVELCYDFKNVASNEIRLQAATVSCGCASYAVSKNSVSPGEIGQVRMMVDLKGKTGTQFDVSLALKTDEGVNTYYNLKGTINCPAEVEIEPRVLRWRVGEAMESKRVTVKISQLSTTDNISLLDFECSSSEFDCRIERAVEPDHYYLIVTPKQITRTSSATISLKFDKGRDERGDDYQVFIRVGR